MSDEMDLFAWDLHAILPNDGCVFYAYPLMCWSRNVEQAITFVEPTIRGLVDRQNTICKDFHTSKTCLTIDEVKENMKNLVLVCPGKEPSQNWLILSAMRAQYV